MNGSKALPVLPKIINNMSQVELMYTVLTRETSGTVPPLLQKLPFLCLKFKFCATTSEWLWFFLTLFGHLVYAHLVPHHSS